MRLDPKPSASEQDWGGCVAEEPANVLLDRKKLHVIFECLTAASFALELAKESEEQRIELISRASKLLAEAMEEIRAVMDREKGDN
jgi:hypothetical protein